MKTSFYQTRPKLIFFALAFLMSSAGSVEISLTQKEKGQCAEEGGCFVVSAEAMQKAVLLAYQAGQATCESRL